MKLQRFSRRGNFPLTTASVPFQICDAVPVSRERRFFVTHSMTMEVTLNPIMVHGILVGLRALRSKASGYGRVRPAGRPRCSDAEVAAALMWACVNSRRSVRASSIRPESPIWRVRSAAALRVWVNAACSSSSSLSVFAISSCIMISSGRTFAVFQRPLCESPRPCDVAGEAMAVGQSPRGASDSWASINRA